MKSHPTRRKRETPTAKTTVRSALEVKKRVIRLFVRAGLLERTPLAKRHQGQEFVSASAPHAHDARRAGETLSIIGQTCVDFRHRVRHRGVHRGIASCHSDSPYGL